MLAVQELMPLVRINALAAAGLALIVGLLSPWLAGQASWVAIVLAVGYVLITQRWLAKPLTTPPWKQERKGSFKKKEPSRKEMIQWTLKVTLAAIGTQILTFMVVYTLVAGLIAGLLSP